MLHSKMNSQKQTKISICSPKSNDDVKIKQGTEEEQQFSSMKVQNKTLEFSEISQQYLNSQSSQMTSLAIAQIYPQLLISHTTVTSIKNTKQKQSQIFNYSCFTDKSQEQSPIKSYENKISPAAILNTLTKMKREDLGVIFTNVIKISDLSIEKDSKQISQILTQIDEYFDEILESKVSSILETILQPIYKLKTIIQEIQDYHQFDAPLKKGDSFGHQIQTWSGGIQEWTRKTMQIVLSTVARKKYQSPKESSNESKNSSQNDLLIDIKPFDIQEQLKLDKNTKLFDYRQKCKSMHSKFKFLYEFALQLIYYYQIGSYNPQNLSSKHKHVQNEAALIFSQVYKKWKSMRVDVKEQSYVESLEMFMCESMKGVQNLRRIWKILIAKGK